MANNRLYIVNPKTRARIMLAKGWGAGWDLWATEKALAAFLAAQTREGDAGATALLFRTEADLTDDEERYANFTS